MNKKLLCCALLGALGVTQSALAQEFDDRWYIHGGGGLTMFDSERRVDDDWHAKLGFGKMWSPNFALDFDLHYVNPQDDIDGSELNWSLYGAGVSGRWFFREPGDTWRPYLTAGVGALRHEDEFSDPLGGPPEDREDTNLFVDVGAGLQADYGRWAMRAEIGPRMDFDDGGDSGEDQYLDFMASVGVLVKLGPEPTPPAPPPAPEPEPEPVTTCADLDDDGDGVNNCDDRCPNSEAGQAVGPDGCPVPVTIDLRGVNFDFDKATLRPDAIATLNEAIEVLRQYPELRVQVAGHTDECGSDQYNEGLSDRRARAVYDYLTQNGIDASRLSGPVGYGETRPLEQLGDAFPGCKSETNRRTELNVEN